eukprot:4780028-Pyramimonas_sp.AAC.1
MPPKCAVAESPPPCTILLNRMVQVGWPGWLVWLVRLSLAAVVGMTNIVGRAGLLNWPGWL